MCRVVVCTAYMDDEKKQVLQLFGQRSGDITRCQNCVLCDLPHDLENPALLVTGLLLCSVFALTSEDVVLFELKLFFLQISKK